MGHMCGDSAALVNPGPINQSIDYAHLEKLWENERNNCKINEKKDIELYKEFDSWLKNEICTEREREKMKEIFIEKEIDWRNEIKCVTRNTRTYTRIKNCRKNNILENWKKKKKKKKKKMQNDQEKIKPNNKSNEWINVRKNLKQNKVNEIQQIPAMPSHVT